MCTRIVYCAAAAWLLCVSAGCPRRQSAQAAKSQERPPREYGCVSTRTSVTWSTTKDGPPGDGYIFYRWTMPGQGGLEHHYAVLKEGYGMMVFYEWYPEPRQSRPPRFELFAYDRGMILKTTDIAEVKRLISQIPAGETLQLFDTCTRSTHVNMDPDILKEVEDSCRPAGITYLSDGGMICSCF
jgi:hypothetical protein